MSDPAAKPRPRIDIDEFERRLRGPEVAQAASGDPLAELTRLVEGGNDPFASVIARPARPKSGFLSSVPTPGFQQAPQPAREPPPVDPYLEVQPAEISHVEVQPPQSRGLEAFDEREELAGDHVDPDSADGSHSEDSQAAQVEPLKGIAPETEVADVDAWEKELSAIVGKHEPLPSLRSVDDDLFSVEPHETYAPRNPEEAHESEVNADARDVEPLYARENPRDEFDAVDEHFWSDDAPAAMPPQTPPPAENRSRRNVYLMAGAVGAIVVGIAGTFAMKGGPSSVHDTPIIRAAPGPTKIQPEKAASAAPSPSATILDKTGEKLGVSRIVGQVEQPVDIAATAKPRVAPSVAAGSSIFPEPIKVKTVPVRPDGSIVAPDSTVGTTQRLPEAQSQGAPPPERVAAPAAPSAKATTRIAARAEQPALDPDDAAVKPVAAKPVLRPAPKPVQRAATEPAAHPAGEATPQAGGGGFAVQVGTASSDAEARAKATRLQAKFGGAFDGRRATVVKSEVNGSTIYRVRVVGLSQEGATSMCAKLKSDGGECFVAR